MNILAIMTPMCLIDSKSL